MSVITAIYGGRDEPPPVPFGFHEAVLVSDKRIVSDWRNVVLPSELPPRLAAKLPRARPDLFCSNPISCWIDANVSDPHDWLAKNVREGLEKEDLVLFDHPKRTSVRQEIEFLKKFSKFRTLPMDELYERYEGLGFQDDAGLFYTGVIGRRHTQQMEDFGNAWLTDITFGVIRDQISFPYLVTKRSLRVGVFDGDPRVDIELREHPRNDYFSHSLKERLRLRLDKLK